MHQRTLRAGDPLNGRRKLDGPRPAKPAGVGSRRGWSRRAFVAALAVLTAVGCDRRGSSDELTVYAAASLQDALEQLGRDYEQAHPSAPVSFNFAGSNTLARQIVASPKADVFVSASERWMDEVERAGHVVPGTRRALLGNRLVVIANAGSSHRLESLADLPKLPAKHFAIGAPDAVPAGQYARQALSRAGVWQSIEPRVLAMPDVRAALAQVEKNRDVVGLVYRTDARASDAVRVLYELGPQESPEIRYPVALIRGGRREQARRFVDLLVSDRGRAVFEQHGFVFLPQ